MKTLRPSFHEIYARFAQDLARRSECERLSVGCVIASEDNSNVFSIGYNGPPSRSRRKCRGKNAEGSCGCAHAEANAIAKCSSSKHERKIVYCTHMPCELCATLFVNMGGVVRVWWAEDYRLTDGQDILMEAGISAAKLLPGEL